LAPALLLEFDERGAFGAAGEETFEAHVRDGCPA